MVSDSSKSAIYP